MDRTARLQARKPLSGDDSLVETVKAVERGAERRPCDLGVRLQVQHVTRRRFGLGETAP